MGMAHGDQMKKEGTMGFVDLMGTGTFREKEKKKGTR